jgi:hypothetical protein
MLAVAGDDQQRVVDADAQTDHDAQEGGEVGDGQHVAEDGDDGGPQPDAEQRHAHRQAHGQHRAERHDQDDDGEGQADLLGRGLLELGEHEPAQLDAQAVDVGHVRVDLVADLAGLGHVDVVGELDVGVGDAVRAVAPGRDLALVALVVGALHADHVGDVRDLGEQVLHARPDLGVVDALVGDEHDRADRAGALAAEVFVEDVEALAGLDVGEVELVAEGAARHAGHGEAEDDDGDPEPEYEPAVIVAPGAQSGEHGESAPGCGGRDRRR